MKERAARVATAETEVDVARSAKVKGRLPADTIAEIAEPNTPEFPSALALPNVKVLATSASKPRNAAVSRPAVVEMVALSLPPGETSDAAGPFGL
jgi:hypothetical protein